MRVLLVDDEAPARRKLKRLLANEPGVEIVGEAADGVGAVRLIEELGPDVVFLDIRMPGADGFQVIEEVGTDAMPLVVFVTAFDEHALRAFDVRALDYVLKPVSPDRFAEVVDRIRERLAGDGLDETRRRLAEVVEEMRERSRPLARLMVRGAERARLLPVERIDRFEADRNYVHVHAGEDRYTIRATLTSLESRLDPDRFLRINRSEIVRIDVIDRIEPWFHGDFHVVLADGTKTTWSRRYRARNAADFEP
ncbi:MAG: LytTR family DNA-binding domain-containing protein [Gemmatimonadota bacterium]|nr:LytTR family DNA-binding domain-containing protein [Gemmatimonadota bacterium]